MPSLRIASTGASIESARTIRMPCGSCNRGIDIRRPTIGAIRTSASSASRDSASSVDSAPSRRSRSSVKPAEPSTGIGGNRLAPRLQIGGGDACFDRGLAGGGETRQRAHLIGVVDHVAAGHRHVAVEGRFVAGIGGDVERDLLPHRHQRAQPRSRLGGKALDRFVEEEVPHGSGFSPATNPPAAARTLAGGN